MISFMACWMAFSTSGSSILETTSKLLSGILLQGTGILRLWRKGVQPQDGAGAMPQGSHAADFGARKSGGLWRLGHGIRQSILGSGRGQARSGFRGGLGLERREHPAGD